MTWKPFELLPLKERANFYKDNAALYNDALEAKMREVLTQITRKRGRRPPGSRSGTWTSRSSASTYTDKLKKALADKTAEVEDLKKELVKTKKELEGTLEHT